MIFEQIAVGGDRNFSYLIGDASSQKAMIIDPSYHPKKVLERAQTHQLTIEYLVNTHQHHDHINGNEYILKHTDATLAGITPRSHGQILHDGDILTVGNLSIQVIATPGHTPDCLCLLVENKLLTGDTLFVGKVGGTYSEEGARDEYNSLHKKIMTLPDETEVWPGHNYGVTPSSTIAHEKTNNPFLKRPSFETFLHLKNNWALFKVEHGIE